MKYLDPLPGFVRDEMSRLLDLAWRDDPDTTVRPQLTLREEGNSYRIDIDLPGVRPGDVELNVYDRSLRLTARRSAGAHTWGYREQVDLPTPIDTEGVVAGLSDGVLRIVCPTQHHTARGIPIADEHPEVPTPTREDAGFLDEATPKTSEAASETSDVSA